MIATNDFTEAMEQHWTGTLANVSSEALRDTWAQLADAFNAHIAAHDDPKKEREWTVLQPPTGSGKSQGTIVYCAMLAKRAPEAHPGVLIVTRLKADADAMAQQINDMARACSAVAYHSDVKATLKLGDLWQYPVLVITHRAYELALDMLGQHGTIQQTWPYFHQRELDCRKLVVIDEALDIVEESQAGLEGLRLTLAAIPSSLRARFPQQIAALQEVIRLLEEMERISTGRKISDCVLLKEMVKVGTAPDITALRAALREVPFDRQLRKSDPEECARLLAIHDKRLKSLQHIFKNWIFHAKTFDEGHSLNTARLLVPDNVKGAVVLDATASANVLYELFKQARVVPCPPNVRHYGNVTLHVSRGHKLGKVHMRSNARALSGELIAALNEPLEGRDVFICTHRQVEPILLSHASKFTMHTGHWGAVDGSNAWKDCDAAVIFGLPYMPDAWSANAFFALQGIQDTDWLRSQSRPWGAHDDIRAALKSGQMVTDIVQAINRIRCRKVIDARGNCPKADVFLLLPDGATGEAVLEGVLKQMPGIEYKAWDFSGARRKAQRPRRSNHEAALVQYIKTMLPGRVAVSSLKRELGMSADAFKRIARNLQLEGNEVANTMASCGVRYHVEGVGRGARSSLVKG